MKFSDLHKNVKIRLIIGFFQRILNQMIIPFMAIYFASNFGVKWAGLLTLSVILSGIIVSFYGGYIADIRGRRPLLLITEISNFFIFLLMALFNSPWITSALVTYFLFLSHSIFTNLGKPSLDAIIIDVSTPQTRKFIYTINYWAINLSFAFGAMIGAFFYEEYFFQVLLIASGSTLIIFMIYLFYISETMPFSDRPKKFEGLNIVTNIIRSYKEVMKDNLFMKFVIVSIIMMGIEFQLTYYISVRLAEEFSSANPLSIFGIDHNISGVEMYGILRTENTILVVLTAFFLEKLLKQVTYKSRLYIGTVFFSVGYMFLGSNNSFWILIVSMLVITLAEMTYVPISQSILSVIINEEKRTTYMAVYGLHQRMGMVIASLSLSLASLLSPITMSILYGFLGLSAFFIFRNIINSDSCKEKMKVLEAKN